MKSAICFLLFSVLLAGVTTKSASSEEDYAEPPSSAEISAKRQELMLNKLEQIERKLTKLQKELMKQHEKVVENRVSHEKTFTEFAKDVARNMSLLQDQTLLILAQQSACATHEQFSEKFFNLTAKDNDGQGLVQPQEVTGGSRQPEDKASPTETNIAVTTRSTMPTPQASTLVTLTVPVTTYTPTNTTAENATTTTTAPVQSEGTTSTTETKITVTTPTSIPIAQTTTPIVSFTTQTVTNTTPENGTTTTTTLITTTTAPQRTTILDPESPAYSSCRNVPTKVSGVYIIQLSNGARFNVLCEQNDFEGGWIVVQHRFNGSVDFYRTWDEYRDGFGQLDSEFWLGLERIHQLTSARAHEIIFEMRDFEGNYGFARYNQLEIWSEGDQYRLKPLESYNGTAGDALKFNAWSGFSTKDRNNDGRSDAQWAVRNEGGWWYGFYGGSSNLNGRYQEVREMKSNRWYHLKQDWRGMSFTRIMIREM